MSGGPFFLDAALRVYIVPYHAPSVSGYSEGLQNVVRANDGNGVRICRYDRHDTKVRFSNKRTFYPDDSGLLPRRWEWSKPSAQFGPGWSAGPDSSTAHCPVVSGISIPFRQPGAVRSGM